MLMSDLVPFPCLMSSLCFQCETLSCVLHYFLEDSIYSLLSLMLETGRDSADFTSSRLLSGNIFCIQPTFYIKTRTTTGFTKEKASHGSMSSLWLQIEDICKA